MEWKDWVIVFATLAAPLFAIQATQFIDRRRQQREEQLKVFRTLMATRAATLDPRHVEALNMIDVVFHSNAKAQIEIRRTWKQYLDHLSNKSYPKDTWGTRRSEILVELLHAIATFLGFDFDKTEIKNQCYYPEGFGSIEEEQGVIRRSLAEILSGKKSLPMHITNLPNQNQES